MHVCWGIVGIGQLTSEWIAPAINSSPTGRLVACADPIVERTEQLSSTYDIEHKYESYKDLVTDPLVDAVYVAAPNALHHPIVLAAAAAGKHVLCQKPMAMSLTEANDMVAACKEAGVILRIGLQLRLDKALQQIASMVREGWIGTVREVTAQRYAPTTEAEGWRFDLDVAGAGALADVGVHMIDFVQWIINDEIKQVFALAYPSRASFQPDETSTLLMEFTGGCQATIRCSRELPIGANNLQVFGTGGMISTGPLRWVTTHQVTLQTSDRYQEFEFPAQNLYVSEIETFAKDLEKGTVLSATGEDGLRLAYVTEALIRSLETGAAVPIKENEDE
jgi:1,5-anhydro-D-fructose reductase (1,5-anhydro-D-mannitol-forming)